MAGKKPNPVEVHIGARIRMRRMMLNMSQEKLADSLGITFQQVQKYEKGTNGARGSRLVQLAAALQVSPAYFFEGLPGSDTRKHGGDIVEQFFTLPYAIELAGHYVAIPHNTDRRAVVDVARAIAEPGPVSLELRTLKKAG